MFNDALFQREKENGERNRNDRGSGKTRRGEFATILNRAGFAALPIIHSDAS